MTLRKDPRSKLYSADLRDSRLGRVHLSLRTARKDEAETRQSALRALLRDGDAALIADVRRRRITIEAVTRLYLARRPFTDLRESTTWPTLGTAVDEYLAWIEDHPTRSRNTLVSSRSYLKKALAHFGESTPVASISGESVSAFRVALGARTPPLSPWSVGLHLSRLAALYAWLQKRENRRALETNRAPAKLYAPVDPELIPRRTPTRTRFLSTGEAERLLAATPDSAKLAVALGLLAGLRIGEVVTLRPPPHDIDLELALILIQAKPDIKWRPKSRAGTRQVPIAEALRPFIEAHLARYASEWWVFPSPVLPDAPITKVHLSSIMKRSVTDAELVYGRTKSEEMTFHSLRHTFASWLVMEGTDLFTVARLLGHTTTSQVEATYAHLSPEHRRLAVSRLSARFTRGDVGSDDTKNDTNNAR